MQISLSKIATVELTVSNATQVVRRVAATLERGKPRLLWVTPTKGGIYTAIVSATDLAGNRASISGTLVVGAAQSEASEPEAREPAAGMRRLARAWRDLHGDERLAAASSLGLLVAMLLPWYGLRSVDHRGAFSSHDISAFGDLTFVEAAIFVVALAVLAMLLARVEGRDFRLPGGDGAVVAGAGAWACLLIVYRVFARPSGGGYPVGIEWGVLVALLAAAAMIYAGVRMRARQPPEPPLTRPPQRSDPLERPRSPERPQPFERRRSPVPVPGTGVGEQRAAPLASAPGRRPRYPPAPGERLSWEDPPTRRH